MKQRDPLREIMEKPLESLPYSSHPSDAILRDYSHGRLGQSGSFDVTGLQTGSLVGWHRAEVTAHLLTCRRCAQIVTQMRAEPSKRKALLDWLIPSREPVPAFARLVMLAQFVIILSLVGIIYFKPAPFFSSLSPTASVIPSSEVTKTSRQVPSAPHPQALEQSSDPIPQLVQSYPQTIRVVFREDTPMHELRNLMQSINGILILVQQRGFVVRLPSDGQLDSVMERLSQSPYIIEARKD